MQSYPRKVGDLLGDGIVVSPPPQSLNDSFVKSTMAYAHAERLDGRVCSGWFPVEQSLLQGCVLAPLLFSIFSAAVINVASTRFKADKRIMEALVHLRGKRGSGVPGGSNCRRGSPGDAALGHALC